MFRASAVLLLVLGHIAFAQDRLPNITSPKAEFGFHLGDDYCLANYQQLTAYWKKLEKESDRMRLVDIGATAEGRRQLMAIVTSPANHRKLERYRSISTHLARVEGIDEPTARALAAEGKAVVWIDGGLHATETLCAQVLMETVYRFLSAVDAETLRIFDDVVILFVHANPDGHDLVADWYMKPSDPKKRTTFGIPRLYQKYIGHDNNRDFYAHTQAETKNLNRIMYHEWLPQIVYNHHQSGPPGTVLFCPPFRDPANYRIDPLALNGIDAVGAAMMQRFLVEGKPGATTRSGATYSTWYNGGLRTTSHFHNMIGLLTETIGNPTPMTIPLIASKQLPKGDYLAPIPPGPWRFKQSLEYSITANRAVLDYASRNREHLLFNIWRMGKGQIDAGIKDSWTITPKIVAKAAEERSERRSEFARLFRDPAARDPRGYIIPSDQPDFLTAVKFVNTLLGTGLTVHRVTSSFEVNGKRYPPGSLVIKSAQAFRPHVLDMFEPQDHPNDFAYPGASPTKPYDTAGYTPAFQMGIRFDRFLEGFEGPFEVIRETQIAPPPAKVRDTEGAVGYFLSARTNDAFRAVNQLLKDGQDVRRVVKPFTAEGHIHPPGMFYIAAKSNTLPTLTKLGEELGVRFVGTPVAPAEEAEALRPIRIGLWDRYGGSMPSGWTRWLLEQFDYPFTVVYPPDLDRGQLREKFDVLIFPDGAYSGSGRKAEREPGEPMPADVEATEARPQEKDEWIDRKGSVTAAKTLPQLKKFVEAGGTILAIGGSTSLGKEFGLPVANHLVQKGTEKPLPSEKFYVPPSLLRVKLAPTHPLTWGMGSEADVVFANSPTFRITGTGADRIAWFEGKTPLRSGWAWGQELLDGGTAVVDAPVGKGRVVLYGPQVLFRAQPHGTFKLVFNAIARAAITE